MSTYDAGAIEASAHLGKDPFLEGLKQVQRAGDDFAKQRFTAVADIDRRPAERAFDTLNAKGKEFSGRRFTAKVDLGVGGQNGFDALIRKVEAFTSKTHTAKLVLDIGQADLKLKLIEDRLQLLGSTHTVHTVDIRYNQGRPPGVPPVPPGAGPSPRGGGGGPSSGGGIDPNFSLLGTAIVGLAPALIPLIPLAVGVAGAFGLMGASGILAVKGIEAEEKAGTVTGQRYREGVGQLKQDLMGLEGVAARGVIGPFSQLVAKGRTELPFLNAEVQKFSTLTGKTGVALFDSAINSLHVLDPLFSQVAGWILHGAQGLEQWTANGGLQRFEAYAMRVLPEAEQLIQSLFTTIVRVTQAAGPFGMVSARALQLVSDGINEVPIGALKVLVTTAAAGYIAFQAWSALAPAIATVKKMTAALVAYDIEQRVSAGATRDVAAAQASAAGGLRTMATRYGALVLAAAAAAVIVTVNDKIADSLRPVPASAGDAAKALMDMAQTGELLQSMLGKFGDSKKSLDSIFETTFHESNLTKLKDFQFGLGGLIKVPFASATSDAKNFFESTDRGLAQLVTEGQKATAANAFKIISDQAAKQGITVDQLMAKLPAYRQALQSLADQAAGPIIGLNGALMATQGSLDHVAAVYGVSGTAAQSYAAILGITSDQVKDSTVTQMALAQAVHVVSVAENTATQTTSEYLAAVNTFAQSAGTAADRAALIGATLKASNGDALTYASTMVQAASANQQLVSGLDAQARAAINLKTGVIDYKNAAAAPLIGALQALQTAAMNAAGATYQHELATKHGATAAKDASDQYYAQTHGALIDEATQLGLTKDQARRLADQYFSLPKDITTKIQAIGTDPVVKVLDMIGRQLSYLTHIPWISQVSANTTPAQAKLASLTAQLNAIEHPRGGPVVSANTDAGRLRIAQLQAQIDNLQGKTVPIVIQTLINEANQAAHVDGATTPGKAGHSALGNIYKEYAFGGLDQPNNHQPGIYPVRPDGRARVFAEPETKGEVYAPLANDHRRPRAKAIISQAAQMMGGAAYFAQGAFHNVLPPGIKAATKKGTAASKGLPVQGYEFGGKFYSTLPAAEAGKASAADAIVSGLGTEISGLAGLASASASTIATAMNKIIASAQKALGYRFGGSGLPALLKLENRQLQDEVAQRDRYVKQLADSQAAIANTQSSMSQTAGNVQSAFTGGFNIATAGNGYSSGITSTIDQQVADAVKFEGLIAQARKLGLDPKLVDQLESQGPAVAGANLQALVQGGTASKGYIAHINSQVAALAAVGQRLGQQDAQDLYGKQLTDELAAATAAQRGILAENKAVNKTLSDIRAQMTSLEGTVANVAKDAHQLALQRARTVTAVR